MNGKILFPIPSGKYKIGYFDDVVAYGSEEGERHLGFRCFYPANDASEDKMMYIDEEMYKMYENLAPNSPLCKWYKNYIKLPTHSYKNAKPADGRFKVIIYSPGYNNVTWGNLVQIEELVSNGYVVFAVARSGESFCTILKDRRIAKNISIVGPFNEEIVEYMLEADEYTPDPKFVYNWSLFGMQEYVKKCKIASKRLKIWSDDIIKIIDEAEKIDNDKQHILHGKLDCHKVGAFGNSFGGSASVLTGLYDDRIGACINLDGWLFGGKLLEEKLQSPTLIFGKSQRHYLANYGADNINILSLVFNRTVNEFMCDYCITNEEDVKKFHPNEDIISGKLMSEITTDFIKAFFDMNILGVKDVSLEKLEQKYIKEVHIEK